MLSDKIFLYYPGKNVLKYARKWQFIPFWSIGVELVIKLFIHIYIFVNWPSFSLYH